MAICINCDAVVQIEDQSYFINDLGIELYSMLQERIQQEMQENAVMCTRCFEELSRRLPLENNPEPIFSTHDINRCFSCNHLLRQRRSLILSEGPERNEIERTLQRRIPINARVCYTCWFRARRSIQRQTQMDLARNIEQNMEIPGPSQPPLFIADRCVVCEQPIFQRRTHSLPEGPERNLISVRIHPRQVPNNARACHACWMSVHRNVQEGEGRVPAPALPEQPDQEVRQLPENIEEVPAQRNVQETINLDTVRRFADTSAHCFVPNCRNEERLSVPIYLKKRLLTVYKIYVPMNARVCQEHKVFYDWDFLAQYDLINNFSKLHIEDMLQINQRISYIHIDFNNIEGMDQDRCKFWLGVTVEQFFTLLNESGIQGRNPKEILGIYLLKLRTGEPIRRLASLLRKSPAYICKVLGIARQNLTINFVPRHLGLEHMSREELISRNLLIPQNLFGREGHSIVICDGTYIYVQKSSNYSFQKKSYSLHKYRNLVKPLLFAATDGYILDVFGAFAATASDSDIMKALFQNENHPLRSYFQEGDVFILDRGFRDCIPLLRSLGYVVYTPETLPQGETQLPTLAANKSRCVTLCRWVIEVINGRFKRDYKLFRGEFFNLASRHLMIDFRIAAAMINAFHPLIEDRPDAAVIVNRALERLELPNYLAAYVIENNLNRHRASFTSIDGVDSNFFFPEMSFSDLIIFSLGIYQIKQARSYFGEHIRENGAFVIEVAEVERLNIAIPEINEGQLIRGRIRSRHQSAKVYYTYILLGDGQNWQEIIKGYYCSCICGKRTVGCCAHTMTLVWYLGWARHQNNIEAPASFLDWILIREENEEE